MNSSLWKQVQTKGEDTVQSIQFPVVPFFPWQADAFREFLRNPVLREMTGDKRFKGDGKRAFAYLVTRRGGKDTLKFQEAVFMCHMVPGFNVAYVHQTQTACRKAIMNGTFPAPFPGGPTSFMELVPREMGAVLNKNEGVLKFPNNSCIKFLGADKIDVRGQEINMVVATEYDFWKNPSRANEQIESCLARTNGLWVGGSTLEKRGHWYDICFDTGQVTDDTYHRVIIDAKGCLKADGTRVVTDESLETLRRKGTMTEEQIQREFFHKVGSGVYGMVYPTEVADSERAGRFPKFIDIDPGKPVSTSWDLGSARPTVILFWQQDGNAHYVVDMKAFTRKDREWVARWVQQWAQDNSSDEEHPLRFDRHYLPWDAGREDQNGGRDDGATVSTDMLMRRAGLTRITVTARPLKHESVERVRSFMHHIHISRQKAQKLISALAQYPYERDTRGELLDRPDQKHWSSDYVDAVQSYVLGQLQMRSRRDIQVKRQEAGRKVLSYPKRPRRLPGLPQSKRWMRI